MKPLVSAFRPRQFSRVSELPFPSTPRGAFRSLRWKSRLAAALLACSAPSLFAAEAAFKFVDAKGQPAADVVVSLAPLDEPAPATRADRVEIEQQNQTFNPPVTVLRVGGAVSFTNREPKIMHQIYSQSEAKKFEIALHKPGNTASITFDQPGVVVIGCNIHDSMSAFIFVVETPWFAKSAAGGEARITGLPPGRYRATLQHPRLEKPEVRELTLPAASAPVITLAIKPAPRVRRVLEAGGGGYK